MEFLSTVGFVNRKWEDLRVGDIIKVKKDQYFPCDVILLNHPRDQKTAFIETKNLDGETNLKLKRTCEHL
jgi:P-type E1-E2 ATPase